MPPLVPAADTGDEGIEGDDVVPSGKNCRLPPPNAPVATSGESRPSYSLSSGGGGPSLSRSRLLNAFAGPLEPDAEGDGGETSSSIAGGGAKADKAVDMSS